jgi:hypothetical protein
MQRLGQAKSSSATAQPGDAWLGDVQQRNGNARQSFAPAWHREAMRWQSQAERSNAQA